MMKRNKTYLTARFRHVAKAMGWAHEGSAWTTVEGRNVATVGHVHLEHNTYSGWKVTQIANEGGGERVLSGNVATPAELDAWFSGILFAKEGER